MSIADQLREQVRRWREHVSDWRHRAAMHPYDVNVAGLLAAAAVREEDCRTLDQLLAASAPPWRADLTPMQAMTLTAEWMQGKATDMAAPDCYPGASAQWARLAAKLLALVDEMQNVNVTTGRIFY